MKIKKLSILAVASIGVIIFGGSVFADDTNYFADLEKDLVDGTLIIKADDPKNHVVEEEWGSYNNMMEIIIGILADKYNATTVSYDYENMDYGKLTFEKYGKCEEKENVFKDSEGNIVSSWTSYECEKLAEKTVKAKYTGVDQAKKAKIQEVMKPIASKKKWNSDLSSVEPYSVEDLSFVNYVVAGYGSAKEDDAWRRISNKMMSFSADYRSDLANKNIQILVDNRAGDSGPYFEEALGFAGVISNGYIYDVYESVGARVYRTIYVPESTKDDKDSLKAAAQKRIDDYYKGTNLEGKVKIAYGGFDDDGGEYGPTDFFYVEYGGYKVDCIIRKDDKKISAPTFATGDVNTNIIVSSEVTSIPLDTAVTVEEIEKSNREDQLKKLGISDATIFDISLYSDVAKKKIETLEDGTFKVSIPVDEKFNGKTITVYHFALDGTIEKFDAPVADGYATFVTAHFSEYIVDLSEKAEGKSDLVNPPTSDDVAVYAVLLATSTLAAVAAFIKVKK